MKFIKKIFRKLFLSVGVFMALIILSGLIFRLFGPEPHTPMGKMVDVNGFKFHINSVGTKSDKPTLVIEAGAGLSAEYYYWLSEGLKDSLRVVRYDRSGLGYSELSDTPRNAESIAQELHELLNNAGESPPYILAGHSLGGLYIRKFTQLYSDEVAGMVLIDATHPEQVERFNAAPESSIRFRSVFWSLNVATFFADAGVVGLLESFTGPIFASKGLPDEVNNRTQDFLLNGKCLRAYKAEMENYHATLRMAKNANEFDSLPIRVFTAVEIDKEAYRKRGLNPEKRLKELVDGQKEFTNLSSDGKQFLIDGTHKTIYTKKENATIICNEIMQLVEDLKID